MTEAGVRFQGADAEHLAPHNSSFHGLLHILVYSFNLSGNRGKERLFAQPQSRLKALSQLLAATSGTLGPLLGGCCN